MTGVPPFPTLPLLTSPLHRFPLDLLSNPSPPPDRAMNDIRYARLVCFCIASYFCPHGRTDYPTWVSRALADGECTAVGKDVLEEDPFPPGGSYLFYGNSHLRQVGGWVGVETDVSR